MFQFQKAKCTAETTGIVIQKRWNGNVWFLTVQYFVGDHAYTRTEQMKYRKVKTHKIMNIPVGMRSVLSMGDIQIGDSVRVKYNPYKPKRAFMPDNTGLMLI